MTEAREGDGALRAWWKAHGGTTAGRSFGDLPPALIMLELYRERAEQLVKLEGQEKRKELKGNEERGDLRALRALFSDAATLQQSLIDRVMRGPRGDFFNEDPTFDAWVEMAKRKQIPDDWWGPLGKDGLAAIKAKNEARRNRGVLNPPVETKR